jgi:hypothetical protein
VKRALLFDIVFALLAAALVASVAWDAFVFRLITHLPGSDYWEHTAVLRSLITDPWHPRHPLVVTDAGSPRFGPHFLLVALVARIVHFGPIDAMALASVLNALLFVVGIFVFFRLYFADRRASLYGLVVMFGTWLAGAPHFSNVYKLSVFYSVAGDPSSAALALTLLGLALAVRLLRDERQRPGLLALSAVTWAYIYLTHPLTAMMSLTAAVLLAATEPGVSRRRRLWVAAMVPAGILLAVLWPYYPALGMVMKGTAARVSHRVANAGADHGELHRFYSPSYLWQISGFALLAVPCFGYFVVVRRHLFLVLGTLAMLAIFIVSAFIDIPLGHRFVLLAMFFLQIGVVFLLLALTPRARPLPSWATHPSLRLLAAAATGALLLFLVVSNVRAAEKRFGEFRGGTSHTVRLSRRIGQLVGTDGVVLGDAQTCWSVPTFGPRVVALHHGNPLVPDTRERRLAVRGFYGHGMSDAERARVIERYHVTHVLFTGRQAGPAERFSEQRGTLHELPYGGRLYALRPRTP